MSETACPLCQRKLVVRWEDIRDTETRELFSIQQCEQCGLGVTQPVPVQLQRYYSAEYHGGRHGFTAAMCDRRRVRLLGSPESSAKRRLLDVGCGDGTFLKAAQNAGWQVTGVEKYGARPEKLGFPIIDSLAEAATTGQYHCVTLWHVLEHMSDLHETIASIRQLLAPDGVLLIAVPDAGSKQARLFGPDWLHLDVPRHLFHFTQPSLLLLLEQHGLIGQRLRCTEMEYDMMGWAQSALNRRSTQRNLLFRLLTGRPVDASWLKKAWHLSLGFLFMGLVWLPVLLSGWMGNGGTLIVVGRGGATRV